MKTLNCSTMIVFIAAIVISLSGTTISFASDNDNRYRDDSSIVFSPGYLNAAKYQAEAIVTQQAQPKSLLQNIVAYVQGKTENKVQENAAEKPKPELKQKQSSKGKSNTQAAAVLAQYSTLGAKDTTYKPDGVVVNTEKDVNGKIIAQTFLNNEGKQKRYIYVSNDTTSYSINSVATAINKAGNGDVVFIKSGTYSGSGYFYYKNGISIIGENVNTVILDTSKSKAADSITFLNSSNITLKNMTFIGNNGPNYYEKFSGSWYWGPSFMNCSNILVENNRIDNIPSYGIYISNTKNLTIVNNTITNSGTGIGDDSMYNTGMIANNIISGSKGINPFNGGWSGYGINSGGGMSIINNEIMGNYSSGIFGSRWSLYGKEVKGNYVYDNNTKYSYSFQLGFSLAGNYTYSYATASANAAKAAMLTNPYINPFNLGMLNDKSSPYQLGTLKTTEAGNAPGILKALLTGKGPLSTNLGDVGTIQLADKIGKDSLKESALFIPVKDFNAGDMEIAMKLANILKNPTEDQKIIFDAIKALLGDTEKAQDKTGNQSPDLKKASDDLLQMVANILLAQAVPDLLKQGDVSNIKAMFSELDTQRNKIMRDYAQSTKPYYENMLKDLAKNMAMLQGKNLLNPSITKEELSKLPPLELDKILEKIRSMKDKAFGEEYILQQEAKYRKEYLDPNKQKLEEDMKGMLKNFTGKINDVLKSAEKK